MVKIANDHLTVTIDNHGAEIVSVIDNKTGYEFIWQGDPEIWGRHAPVLFPIVGKLKNDTYYYKGQPYHLSRHGFARDREFEMQKATSNSATFNLKSDEETKKVYPFDFSFQITYILHGHHITVSYEVLNLSKNESLYYSVGGHPAFNVTIDETGEFDGVSIEILPHGQYRLLTLSPEGLINRTKGKYFSLDDEKVSRENYVKDALIFQVSHQNEIILHDKPTNTRIEMKPNRMSFLGVWTPYDKKAPFICLEPWAGVADEVHTNQNLPDKYGIIHLDADQMMIHDYTIGFYKD